MVKKIVLVRGIPGSGKSTFASMISSNTHFEADQFFTDSQGNYKWDANKIGEAHEWCQKQIRERMARDISPLYVANTFTTEKEMKPYFDMAEKYGYQLSSIVIENRHGNENIHSVKSDVIDRMEVKLRNSIKLR